MRFFRRETPETPPTTTLHDAGYSAEKRKYDKEKELLMKKHVERLARIRRLGYEFDLASGKDRNVGN